jgi:hypothetical protein
VDDPALVRVGEGRGDVAEDVDALADRHRCARDKQVAQRPPFDERHREERNPVGLAGGDDRHDVRVLQPRDELDLAMEPVEAHATGQVRWKELDDDLAVQAPLGGQEDVTHPAATELALDGVGVAEGGLESLAEIGHGWDESSGIRKER